MDDLDSRLAGHYKSILDILMKDVDDAATRYKHALRILTDYQHSIDNSPILKQVAEDESNE